MGHNFFLTTIMKHIIFKTVLVAVFLVFGTSAFANNLNISNLSKNSSSQLQFDISWDNSWNSNGYYDAVWVFVKANTPSGWKHVDLVSAIGLNSNVSADDKGVMIRRSTTGAGTTSGTITLNFSNNGLGPFPDFKVFGIEMVRINKEPFYLGDGVSNYRFHQGNDDSLPYYVSNSNAINVGSSTTDINSLAGGLSVAIPSTYPKGFDEFYMMKYETSAEQYMEFLNTLTALQQQNNTQSDLLNITSTNRFVMSNTTSVSRRNPIACDDDSVGTSPIIFYCDLNNNGIPNEVDDGQNIAANFVTTNDCLAYLEWAAMRPMTDMEFEKATRGPAFPIPFDIANGTTTFVNITSRTNDGEESESVANIGVDGLINKGSGSPIRTGALATATSTRLQSGGSYYGVMDLSGNTTEFSIITSNASLGYSYTFGTGELDVNGLSTAWNSLFQYYFYKGGGYYITVPNTEIFSNSYKIIFTPNFDAMNNFDLSVQGVRGCR